MNHDGIHVQHGRLDRGASDVIQAARDIEARLDQLESDLQPLSNDWNGAARQAYTEAKTTWDRAMTEMVELLQQAGHGIEMSNADYRAADVRGASRF